MPFVYIGRKFDLVGKTLWEITGSLKDFGVGRLVVKNRLNRYEETCFLKIITAKPQMDEDNRLGYLVVDEYFRGRYRGVWNMSKVAYKPDYTLIPKHEEHHYFKAIEELKPKKIKIFAPTVEMPPLLKLVAEQRGHHATVLPFGFKIVEKPSPLARIAQEGETPTEYAVHGLGTPRTPRFYEGVLDLPMPILKEKSRQKLTE